MAGATAALLWITSLPLQRFAVQVMQEITALVVLTLAMGVMLWTLARDRTGRATPATWMLLGLVVASVYFTRMPYGIILVLAVGGTLLARAQFNPLKLWSAEIGWFLLPLALLMAIWFAYLPKITATIPWLVNLPAGIDEPYSVAGWLFYPLALVRNSGSPWLFAVYITVLVWVLGWRRSLMLGFLALLVLIQFGMGLPHQNKQDRYIFPILPAFFLLAGYAVATTWRWVAVRAPIWRAVWGGATLLLILHSVFLMRDAITPGAGPNPDPVTPYVAAHIADGPSSLVIGSMEMTYPSAPLLDWRLSTQEEILSPNHAGAAVQIEEGRRLAGLVGATTFACRAGDAVAAHLHSL